MIGKQAKVLTDQHIGELLTYAREADIRNETRSLRFFP